MAVDMNSVAPYDLAPVLSMMGVGLLLALGPLLWVWRRHVGQGAGRRLHALTVLTLFLTFDLTLFGAFTRLTDSGLGCPDWPGCYGNASPHGARHDIAMAQAAQPTGPVTHGKAWIEMVHRYLATGVGALILVLAVSSWLAWRRQRGDGAGARLPSPWWPTLTLVWVCVQGAFGAFTVTWRLFPAIVTLHLLGAIGLLALLCVQAVRRRQLLDATGPVQVGRGLRRLTAGVMALLLLQIALGGWVSTNYAVLACTQFPTCQGSWWPPMDFAQGFEVWRPLGRTGSGEPIDFQALTAIHYAHRLLAYLAFAGLGLLAWRGARVPALRRASRGLAGLALLQLATGLGNVLLGWPLVAAVLHTGGAAAIATLLTWIWSASRAEVAIDSRHADAGVLPPAMRAREAGREGRSTRPPNPAAARRVVP